MLSSLLLRLRLPGPRDLISLVFLAQPLMLVFVLVHILESMELSGYAGAYASPLLPTDIPEFSLVFSRLPLLIFEHTITMLPLPHMMSLLSINTSML